MVEAVFFDFDRTLQDIDAPFHQAVETVFRGVCESASVTVAALERNLSHVWPGLWRRFLDGDLAVDALRAGNRSVGWAESGRE